MTGSWLNLTFHGVGAPPPGLDPGERAVWLSRESFLAHLDRARHHERLMITFDDGNLSDFEIALPALRERGLSATFFVLGARVDRPGYLRREHLVALIESGMVVGSHGMDHRSWRRMDRLTTRREVLDAKAKLEALTQRAIHDVACPFGTYGRRSLAALRAAGFRRVFTSDGGSARADEWLQARNTLHRDDPVDTVDRLVATRDRGVPLLRRVKRLAKRWR